MKNFTINRKVYKAKEFDFNLVCDLEDEGISLEVMQDKPMSMMRAYFGICAELEEMRLGKRCRNTLFPVGVLRKWQKLCLMLWNSLIFFGLPTRQRKRKLRKIRAKRNKKKIQIVS